MSTENTENTGNTSGTPREHPENTENEIKLIVAGGRDFDDVARLRACMDRASEACERLPGSPTLSIVSGMARGADKLAWTYCREIGAHCYEFPADWSQHGRSAGHVRNREMGDFSDQLLAFWDGKSRGTLGMIQYMKGLGKPVHVERY